MLKNKIYTCEFCKTKPDQLSHHRSHLETQKHKDKKELFELKLSKLSTGELQKLYNTTDISIIVDENETNTFIYDNKKLNNNNSNNNENYDNNNTNNTEMSQELKDKIEQSNNVSNKEALKDKIHEIHNYLRNNGAGYGMNALKVFNLLYGLKKIEEKNLLDKVNLKKPDCEFSYLLRLANENKELSDENLTEVILNNVLTSIYRSNISELLFYDIPTNIKSSVFSHLIKEIDKITIIEKTCNVLLSGKIYEYFIGRDESAISELGAYFTDRHIVDYIYKKLDPKINDDGTINSMIDMFGGSGGFTTGYINYLNNKYKNIDWTNNIDKIYHFDMNEDVVKSAGLEFFCLTGVLPNTDTNLKYKNSFTDEFDDIKFKYPITNPPYGGDKIVQSDEQIKRKKIKEYIKEELKTLTDKLTILSRQRQIKKIEYQEKQEKIESDKNKVSVDTCSNRIIKFAKKNKLSGNDKESCSLMLIMDMVDVDGTAIGVLKEGVIFNKTYKDLRKCLVENYNVREVISIPQDQFENTSTKTSIVIFDNTIEKTSNVRFSDLVVERYTEDKFEEINSEIVLIESKDDIKCITEQLVSEATKEDLLNNLIYSLNGKDYNKKEIICGERYELKKLGDLCNCLTTTKHCTNIAKPSGKFKFYNSSQNSNLYVDFCEVKDYSIILGQGGNFNIHFDKDFTPSKHVCVIQSKEKNIELLKYLYYIIPELQKSFIVNGSTIGWLNKTNIRDFNIPIPKSEQKIKEWVDKISIKYDKKNENEKKIKELETTIKYKIKDIGENEDCDEVELGSICKLLSGTKHCTNIAKETGKYKFYNSSQNSDLYVDFCEINEYSIIIGQGGIISIHYDKNFTPSKHVCVLQINNKNYIELEYIYYFLINQLSDFKTNGSTIQWLNKTNIKLMKIKIPKNKQLIKDLEPLFLEIEELQIEMNDAETQYNKLIKELSEEAIPTNQQTEIKTNNTLEVKNEIKDQEVNEFKDNLEETTTTPLTTTKKVKIIKKVVKKPVEETKDNSEQITELSTKKKKVVKKVNTQTASV
jgi:type I restriction-modification system DNA methylase subunit